MPVPAGQPMIPVSARPLTVKTGKKYEVTKAVEPSRVDAAFGQLLKSAEIHQPGTLYLELCIGTKDDRGEERPEMRWIRESGTYMVRMRTARARTHMRARAQASKRPMPVPPQVSCMCQRKPHYSLRDLAQAQPQQPGCSFGNRTSATLRRYSMLIYLSDDFGPSVRWCSAA